MEAENKQSGSDAKRTKRKTGALKWILLVICAVVAFFVFALPAYISSESFRALVIREINKSIGGKVDVGKVTMGWLGGISLTGFRYIDQAGRLSISAKSILIRPSYGLIIFCRPALRRAILGHSAVKDSLAEPLQMQRGFSTDKQKRVKSSFLPIGQVEFVVNQGRVQIDSNEQDLQLSDIDTTIVFSQAEPVGFIELRGECKADYDLAVLSTVADSFLPKGLKLEGKRKQNVTFSTSGPADRLDRLLENLNTKFTFGFDRAEYMGLEFGRTETEIEVKNSLLTISPFSTSVNGGRANFAASVDLAQSPMLLRTTGPIDIFKDVRIADKTSQKLLMCLNPIFASAADVSGIVTFQCEKLAVPLGGGDKKDLKIAGTISVNNLRLRASELLGQIVTLAGIGRQDAKITIRPTRFTLENGLLSYTDMQMDVGDNPVNFSGVIGLDGSLDMMVTLPYTLAGRTVRVGEESKGSRIQLPLKGTVRKPEIDTGKLIEEQLKYQLLQGLRKILE
jgi:hypothetical protein